MIRIPFNIKFRPQLDREWCINEAKSLMNQLMQAV